MYDSNSDLGYNFFYYHYAYNIGVFCTMKQQKSSLQSHNQAIKDTESMVAQDNKGDLMSWVKRKLFPEKDTDNTTFTKQLRSDGQKK